MIGQLEKLFYAIDAFPDDAQACPSSLLLQISRDFFSVANNLGDSVAFNLESDNRLSLDVLHTASKYSLRATVRTDGRSDSTGEVMVKVVPPGPTFAK
jgi:hypothetical protein